jgi:hypothetical protein
MAEESPPKVLVEITTTVTPGAARMSRDELVPLIDKAMDEGLKRCKLSILRQLEESVGPGESLVFKCTYY